MLPEAVSINITAPLWRTSNWQENISALVTSYRHNLLSVGGYWSAEFGLKGGLETLEEWADGGLGRHVEVRNAALDIIWEGFVNQVDATIGRLTLTIGQLLDVTNIADLVYSFIDSGPGPPTVGLRRNTGVVENEDSQNKWGVRMKVLSTAGATPATAQQLLDMFMAENYYPPKEQTFNNTIVSKPRLSIQCLGYVHWMDYVYNQQVTTGDGNVSDKLLNILTGTDAGAIPPAPYNLNSTWLPFSTTHVDENTSQTKLWEEDDHLAWYLAQELTSLGDAALNRWLFGIYAGREVWYHPAPTGVEYLQRITGESDAIFSMGGTEVFPWDLKPGKWMMFPDFMATRRHPDNLREDPRAMFIESVDYTAPYTVSAKGGKTPKLDQLLAQKGLSGIGA